MTSPSTDFPEAMLDTALSVKLLFLFWSLILSHMSSSWVPVYSGDVAKGASSLCVFISPSSVIRNCNSLP